MISLPSMITMHVLVPAYRNRTLVRCVPCRKARTWHADVQRLKPAATLRNAPTDCSKYVARLAAMQTGVRVVFSEIFRTAAAPLGLLQSSSGGRTSSSPQTVASRKTGILRRVSYTTRR